VPVRRKGDEKGRTALSCTQKLSHKEKAKESEGDHVCIGRRLGSTEIPHVATPKGMEKPKKQSQSRGQGTQGCTVNHPRFTPEQKGKIKARGLGVLNTNRFDYGETNCIMAPNLVGQKARNGPYWSKPMVQKGEWSNNHQST